MVDDAVVKPPVGVRVRRVAVRVLLTTGVVVTLVCVLLPIACWRGDMAIEKRMGTAAAEVVSVSFNRTVVRYATPDGRVIIPNLGVLYPEGLEPGQRVRVEYDQANPELTRVAGRTAALSLLPVSTFLLAVWVVIGVVVTVLRRFRRKV
ncbi:hypothetical protein Lesp02_28140 [Lentzea sp. NBRC 105346]|uniref:DUF3592 domain-containing protein n=1 Tax=Lentzea sp. NBRC 105346 TaxID=3032205 RepID=UPI00255437F9|nr:DUF3592 domain-containing protein [Lentzea sp. NBRC 105346]GLZ30625.1 hypothetical protein Lesp02_28140 [Lentzea sp. NBRC 105346]